MNTWVVFLSSLGKRHREISRVHCTFIKDLILLHLWPVSYILYWDEFIVKMILHCSCFASCYENWCSSPCHIFKHNNDILYINNRLTRKMIKYDFYWSDMPPLFSLNNDKHYESLLPSFAHMGVLNNVCITGWSHCINESVICTPGTRGLFTN